MQVDSLTAASSDIDARCTVDHAITGTGHALHPVPGCSSLQLIRHWLPAATATEYLQRLRTEQCWPENSYEMCGRRFTLPRLQTWHADDGVVYSYSNNLLQTRPWTPLLRMLKSAVESELQLSFNAVLVNYYRNGEDYVGWHSDDEIELGPQPMVASLTLGDRRLFSFRPKSAPAQVGSVALDHGSLLLMQPAFQHHWQHAVLPDGKSEGRINLTFRAVQRQVV